MFFYKYISGEIPKERLFIRDSDFYNKNMVEVIQGLSVKGIEIETKSLLLSDGKTLPFDRLLIATGAEPVIPEVNGITGEAVLTFKTLDNAEEIISRLEKIKDAAIIGGGFIGLEIAEALLKRGINVTVLEKEDRILPTMLDTELSVVLKEHLERHGARFLLKSNIVSIERKDGKISGVRTEKNSIPSDMVILAAGLRPSTSMFKDVLETRTGIVVNEYMESSQKGIYAAGDVAEMTVKGKGRINPIWLNATKSGEIAGYNMVGIKKAFREFIPRMNIINLFGMSILSAGSISGERFMKKEDSSGIKKIYLDQEDRLQGVQIIGDVLKAGVLINLIGRRLKNPEVLLEEPNYGMLLADA